MENEPIQKQAIFESAWGQLTDEEKKVVNYTHFHFSGEDEHKLPNQDQLEKNAKGKLAKAGVDVENLDKYLEAEKK